MLQKVFAALAALIAYLTGRRAGQAAAAQSAASLDEKVQGNVAKAEDGAPVSRADTLARLRDGSA